MALSEWLNFILAVSTALAVGMGVISYGSRRALREANGDLRARLEDLEKADKSKTAQIAELRSRNEVLTSMVTGEVHWKALSESQDQFIRDAHKHWAEEVKALDKTLICLDKVIKHLERLP